MKIAIVTPGVLPLPPRKGGSVEIVAHGLAEELSKEVETLIFSKRVKGVAACKQKGNRTDIRIPFISKDHYLAAVSSYIGRTKPSCIQIENRPLYVLYLKKKWPEIKMILSLHSLTFVENLPAKTAAAALSAADQIFVNSIFIKRELRRLFPSITTKIIVRYLGVSENVFADRFSSIGSRLRMKWRRKFGLQNKKVLLYVGRLIPEKGVHLLLKSLPELIKHFPETHLLIVGSSHYGRQLNTPYIKKLKTLIRPIVSHITFTNYLPPKIVPQIYQAADLVVTPSTGKEAFCLVNLEASISGIPVITTDVGGIPEVISHQLNGFLIQPTSWHHSFIQYATLLLTDKELNQSMGKNGQTIAYKRFTWRKNARRYVKLYQNLLRYR